MDPNRFDRLSRLLATRRSRRQALGAGLAATGLLAGTRLTSAQDATPVATPAFPADPHPSADSAATHPEFLFVQPFEGGTWSSKAGAEGVFLLTLTGVAAETTYFSDRPERITGLAPTQPFLDGLGFTPDNPPNAAIVAQAANGEQDVLVMELFSPIYDADAAILTYEAKVLPNYGKRGLSHLAKQQIDYELAPTFGEGSLFIDDCPDTVESCFTLAGSFGACTSLTYVGNQTIGQCYDWANATCGPTCIPDYQVQCAANFPSVCVDAACFDDLQLCGSPACCAEQGGCPCPPGM